MLTSPTLFPQNVLPILKVGRQLPLAQLTVIRIKHSYAIDDVAVIISNVHYSILVTSGDLVPSAADKRTTLACKKGKGFPYSIPSVGPGADPGVQAVSPQVTVSHPPGGRLPLLSARPAVTFSAAEHHRPLAGTKLYCLVTEAHRCKQLA